MQQLNPISVRLLYLVSFFSSLFLFAVEKKNEAIIFAHGFEFYTEITQAGCDPLSCPIYALNSILKYSFLRCRHTYACLVDDLSSHMYISYSIYTGCSARESITVLINALGNINDTCVRIRNLPNTFIRSPA